MLNIATSIRSSTGSYAAFEPNEFDGQDEEYAGAPDYPESGRFNPYWVRSDGEVTFEVVPDEEIDSDDYAAVKAAYDRDNTFHHNKNIRPLTDIVSGNGDGDAAYLGATSARPTATSPRR